MRTTRGAVAALVTIAALVITGSRAATSGPASGPTSGPASSSASGPKAPGPKARPALASAPAVVPPTVPASPSRIVLVGDSVAGSLAAALTRAAAARGIEVIDRTKAGCGMTSAVPVATNNPITSAQCAREASARLASVPPADVVVWLSTWEVNSHVVDGRVLEYRSPDWDRWFLGVLADARDRFGRLFLVTVSPRQPVLGVPTMTPEEAADTLALNEIFRRFAAANPTTVGIVDLNAIVCPTAPECPEFIDGRRLRPHMGAHYEGESAEWVAPRLLDAVLATWEAVGTAATSIDGLF